MGGFWWVVLIYIIVDVLEYCSGCFFGDVNGESLVDDGSLWLLLLII